MNDAIAELNQRYAGRLVAVGVNCSCGTCSPITPTQATRGIWKQLRANLSGGVTLDLVDYTNAITASKSGAVIFLYPTDEEIDLGDQVTPNEIKAKLAEYNRRVGKLVRVIGPGDRRMLARGNSLHPSQTFIAGEFRYSPFLGEFSVTPVNSPRNVWRFGVGSWEVEVLDHGVLT